MFESAHDDMTDHDIRRLLLDGFSPDQIIATKIDGSTGKTVLGTFVVMVAFIGFMTVAMTSPHDVVRVVCGVLGILSLLAFNPGTLGGQRAPRPDEMVSRRERIAQICKALATDARRIDEIAAHGLA